jgi:hypothetical protein
MAHELQELQDAQDDIRWDKFMFGNISVLWQEIVLSRNRKTELRTVVDKCAYPEDLVSGMVPMGTYECDLTQLR